jgi:hypothetical protein
MVLSEHGNEPYAPFNAENPLKHNDESMYRLTFKHFRSARVVCRTSFSQ